MGFLGEKPGEDPGELSAIAVLAVALYHVHVPWITGGFVGVDIFFVISGFLDDDREAMIRSSVIEFERNNRNATVGPDFSGLTSDDSLHIQIDTKLTDRRPAVGCGD